MRTAAASEAGPSLAVGILSFSSPTARQRRDFFRALLRPSPHVILRFLLPRHMPDTDAQSPDVLLLPVADGARTVGTFLLTNAFFRHALALQPRVDYICRADDDSLFDPPTVLAEMRAFDTPRGRSFVYGPFHEWFMWSPSAMMPACFDYSRHRFHVSITENLARQSKMPSNQSLLDAIPRFQRECLLSDTTGPYPFAKGPLVAYSRPVAERLLAMPQLVLDETYALRERGQRGLRSVLNGHFYRPGMCV